MKLRSTEHWCALTLVYWHYLTMDRAARYELESGILSNVCKLKKVYCVTVEGLDKTRPWM